MASTELEPPRCQLCEARLTVRNPPGGHTPEQRFCGIWYDHPPYRHDELPFGHTASVLFASPELLAQLESLQGGAAA